MEKVKISKELASAIDYYKKDHGEFWKHHLLADAIESERYIGKVQFANEVKVFTESGGLEILLRALVNDYEVEETPEDRVKARYERAMKDRKLHSDNGHDASESYWDAYGSGIFDCLNDLNIKIEGIN